MDNIEEKLFHGINLNNYDPYIGNLTEIKILEMILSSGQILTREDLNKINSNIIQYINNSYSQHKDEVCVAFHPYNIKYQSKEDKYEDAYYDFVMFHISIILKENLLYDKVYSITGMPREVRIKSSILLSEYIEAIGYYDKITSMIEKLEKLIENENYSEIKKLFFEVYYRDFIRAQDVKAYVRNEYIEYHKIQKILKKHNYNIQIVDPFTGQEFNNIDDSIINAEKVIKKIKSIREKI